jgi:queuosine biosynthesis protein QueC
MKKALVPLLMICTLLLGACGQGGQGTDPGQADQGAIRVALGDIESAEIKTGYVHAQGLLVPGVLFLTYAAAVAYRRGLRHLVGGMCETDFSGYPDCRDDTLKALQAALTLGMDRRFVIDTPLMWIDKAATWALADELGGRALIDLIVEENNSCYQGERGHRNPRGNGCGVCPACQLRAAGFAKWIGGVSPKRT